MKPLPKKEKDTVVLSIYTYAIRKSLIVVLQQKRETERESVRERINRTLKLLCGSVSDRNGPIHHRKCTGKTNLMLPQCYEEIFLPSHLGPNRNRCAI